MSEDEGVHSWGWTDLSSYSEEEVSIMSRRSLRLNDGLLDRSLPHCSTSFSLGGGAAGGGAWWSNRCLKPPPPRRSSSSWSGSLLLPQTPQKPSVPSPASDASDASLISCLLDHSSIQESTLVDNFWGLDDDHLHHQKESSIVATETSVTAHSPLIGPDSRLYCRDHSPPQTSTICCRDHSPPQTSTICCRDHIPSQTSTIYCRDHSCRTAPSSTCGVMDQKKGKMEEKRDENPEELHPDGSLCDDCKEKQLSGTSSSSSSSSSSSCSSVISCLGGFLFSAAVFTGQTAAKAFRWIWRRWCHVTAGYHLTKGPLRLVLVLVLVLVPVLLLSSPWWFFLDGLPSVLPGLNVSQWRTDISDVPGLSSLSQSGEGAVEEDLGAELLHNLPADIRQGVSQDISHDVHQDGHQGIHPEVHQDILVDVSQEDSERLLQVEQSLELLRQQVKEERQWTEQRHEEVLNLYEDVLQRLDSQSSMEAGLRQHLDQHLEQQLFELRGQLDKERRRREQVQQQHLFHQRRQTSRLKKLEMALQRVVSRCQELQQTSEASRTLPAALSVAGDPPSHNALLLEVSRLDASLGDVRRNVERLSTCQDGRQRLDAIQQTVLEQVSVRVLEQVSARVREQIFAQVQEEVQVLAVLPESLLPSMSLHFVTKDDLQEAVASLELRLLQRQHSQEVSQEDRDASPTPRTTAVTKEDVHHMVSAALRRFSEDRTSLADYALESGGGSVLSTRCSETYETKAALLSLFGVPLWYFSQSPRAVIQPDVHPGNCWAFRGSRGFLVIRLSMRILPSSFTLEHIPRTLAPSGTLRSAPRDFSVYGLEDESQDRGQLLGSYTYQEDGDALQTFTVTEQNKSAFQILEVQVSSNWGHPDYTCMYRFRVHGTPSSV